jgi:peptidoglycan-N-acetylglucosamine deacetylase
LPYIGNLPVAGGFHMRMLPSQLVKSAIKTFNNSRSPAVLYIHPGDIDPTFPHFHAPWYYYWGVKDATKKISSILREFRFSSVREVLSF